MEVLSPICEYSFQPEDPYTCKREFLRIRGEEEAMLFVVCMIRLKTNLLLIRSFHPTGAWLLGQRRARYMRRLAKALKSRDRFN